MHNNSNIRNKQMVTNTCKIHPFQNFAGSCLQNDPFSWFRASHWRNTPFFAKMGTSVVYVLVGIGRAARAVCTPSMRSDNFLHATSTRRAANPPKVLYLRSLMYPPPTHLVCNDHLIANFLSFHMSLVVVMNCGAGNALRGFEISMFIFF